MFEKMLNQMKGSPAQPTSAAPPSARPAAPLITIPGTSQAPAGGSSNLEDMNRLIRELRNPTTVVTSAK